MLLTAAQIDHHIEILRELDKFDLAETLEAYASLIQRMADEECTEDADALCRILAELGTEARRLRGTAAVVAA